MREIINVQIGKCGNNIGTQYWELLCAEHGLDETGTFRGSYPDVQLQKINSYFREIRGLRYIPRSVMIDLDKETMDGIKSSPYCYIFKPDNFIYGWGGTGTNWAKGYLTEGLKLNNMALDVIRHEAESTDCLQAFQILHSVAGGTGSGMASLIMDSLKDEYPNRNISSFTVIPSANDPKAGVEIYNSVLSLSHLVVQTDETYLMDNLALHHLLSSIPVFKSYTLPDLNYVISSAISGITTSMRFYGETNTDFRKIAVNLVPYPRLHFFVPALAPLTRDGEIPCRLPTVLEIYQQLFQADKMFVDCNTKQGKFLTVAALFRGRVCMKDVVRHMYEIQMKDRSKFVDWVPDNAKTFVYEIPAKAVHLSGTLISNTTAIQLVLKEMKEQFSIMLKRKAFLTSYKSEGMQEIEFEEAANILGDIIEEYKKSQNMVTDASYVAKGSDDDDDEN